jgi:hypothetical protein
MCSSPSSSSENHTSDSKIEPQNQESTTTTSTTLIATTQQIELSLTPKRAASSETSDSSTPPAPKRAATESNSILAKNGSHLSNLSLTDQTTPLQSSESIKNNSESVGVQRHDNLNGDTTLPATNGLHSENDTENQNQVEKNVCDPVVQTLSHKIKEHCLSNMINEENDMKNSNHNELESNLPSNLDPNVNDSSSNSSSSSSSNVVIVVETEPCNKRARLSN